MTKKNRIQTCDKVQFKLFLKKAREIGADEEKSEADAIMGQLHKKPPKPRNEGNK